MLKKLHISLIFRTLAVTKPLSAIVIGMHHFIAKFRNILEICKKFAGNQVNEKGNVPRGGVVPTFSDLEVVALSITAEAFSIDSENYLVLFSTKGVVFHDPLVLNVHMPSLEDKREYTPLSLMNTKNCFPPGGGRFVHPFVFLVHMGRKSALRLRSGLMTIASCWQFIGTDESVLGGSLSFLIW